MSLSIKFAVSSQEGKIKSAGVDAFLAEPELGLFAIATGEPRGAEKGAASSAEIFLSTLREHIGEVAEAVGRQQGAWGQLGKLFGHVFQKSSQAIHDAFAGRVPNTSATILLLRGDRGAVTHVGRTRAYAIRGGEVARLTEEHVDTDKDEYDADMTQLAVRPTGIGEQSLGQQKSVEVGGVLFKLKPGARFVLISQGIAGLVRGEALLQISRASTDVDGCAAAVVAAATERQIIEYKTALVVHLGDG